MSIPLHRPAAHDPSARLPYGMDFTAWLAAENDTFVGTPDITVTPVSSPVGSPPEDLTVMAMPAPSYVAGVATWWLEGGQVGTSYQVTVRVLTTGGRRDERTVTVRVEER